MDILTIDFETYYDKEYSLRKLTMQQYIMSPLFEVVCVAVKKNNEATQHFTGDLFKTKVWLEQFDWRNSLAVAHNALFDMAILSWQFGIHPKMMFCTMQGSRPFFCPFIPRGSMALAKVSEYLHLGVKGMEVTKALGVRRLEFNGNDLLRYALYCRNDVDLCFKIAQKLIPLFPKDELRLLDLNIRKYTEPKVLLDREVLTAELIGHKERKAAALLKANIKDPALLRSNEKFATVLKLFGVNPPMKISPTTGKQTYAFAKNDLGMQALKQHPNEDVQALVAARLSEKSTLEETRLTRFLAVRETAEWFGVPLLYYGAHCMPGDAEVLTNNGWRRLDEWKGGEIVQVKSDLSMSFKYATRYVGPVIPTWVEVNAPYYKTAMTLGHTVPYIPHGKKPWGTMRAADLTNRAMTRLPVAGVLDTSKGSLTPEDLRVWAMVQADGNFVGKQKGGQLRIYVEKPRKIARCRKLLKEAGIQYREKALPSKPNGIRFVVPKKNFPGWLSSQCKHFDSRLLHSSYEARKAFLDELVHWDGWTDHSGKKHYTSTNKSAADMVITLGAITGMPANLCYTKLAKGNRGACYDVSFRTRNAYATQVKKKHINIVHKARRAYCATTETGFWLCRHRGAVFITGNTGRLSGYDKLNLQNLGRGSGLRRALTVPPGYKMVVGDLSQIEARMVATLAGQGDLIKAFAEGKDVYSIFASTLFNRTITKSDKKERFLGKTSIIGNGYGVGPEKFFNTVNASPEDVTITSSEAGRIVTAYRTTYWKIPELWKTADKWLAHMAQGGIKNFTISYGPLKIHTNYNHKGPAIELPNGMAIYYPGLKRGEDKKFFYNSRTGPKSVWGGAIIENVCQALARIVISAAELYLADRGYIASLQVHDELVYVIPEGAATKFAIVLDRVLTRPVPWMRMLPVAAEVEIGDNYLEAK